MIPDDTASGGGRAPTMHSHGTPADERVLVYLGVPRLGHLQIYADVVTRYFLDRGATVVLACARAIPDDDGALRVPELTLVKALSREPRVQVVDVLDDVLGRPRSEEWIVVVDLQRRYAVDRTFILSGDQLTHAGTGAARPCFATPTHAIFLNTGHVHRHLRPTGMSVRSIRRWLGLIRSVYLREVFFRHIVPHRWGFTSCFSMDPVFTRTRHGNYYYELPDMPQCFDLPACHSSQVPPPCEAHAAYQRFLNHCAGKQVLLYLGGTNQFERKGFDFLLRLASEDPALVVVRVGRTDPGEFLAPPARQWLNRLADQRRLFEHPRFVADLRFVDALFDSIQVLPLPYRGHYESSGNLIQAAFHGKPVLVPDIGLIGHWVREHGIGLTFRHGDYASFKQRYYELANSSEGFSSPLRRFANRFSREAVYAALTLGIYGPCGQ